MEPFSAAESPLEVWPALGEPLGIRLLVKRDDLLPFPLAGNKFRKLVAEQRSARWAPGDTLVTNGAVDSNHCRTVALMGRRLRCTVHLVLHTSDGSVPHQSIALELLRDLDATFDVVRPDEIASTLDRAADKASQGKVHVIPGGAHTPAGVRAYEEATLALAGVVEPDWIVLPSGTGATHAGIAMGAHTSMPHAKVKGISVARPRERGLPAVRECLSWFTNPPAVPIDFDDRFVDGGYGVAGAQTRAAVSLGWRSGLPLDPTYTGKAFRALIDLVGTGEIQHGSTVLFWHTGGLMNHISSGHAGGRRR
jgi:1-aminocyclopropane-1-carboxylate deaminase/D-cysteine desulfhydrase-like pyridoxal-dependent ACC family enzyme